MSKQLGRPIFSMVSCRASHHSPTTSIAATATATAKTTTTTIHMHHHHDHHHHARACVHAHTSDEVGLPVRWSWVKLANPAGGRKAARSRVTADISMIVVLLCRRRCSPSSTSWCTCAATLRTSPSLQSVLTMPAISSGGAALFRFCLSFLFSLCCTWNRRERTHSGQVLCLARTLLSARAGGNKKKANTHFGHY